MSSTLILNGIWAVTGLGVLVMVIGVISKAMPGPGAAARRKAQNHRKVGKAEPIVGGAAGLLESIPYQERRPKGRIRGALKLALTIGALAALLALVMFGAGRAIASWVSSAKHGS